MGPEQFALILKKLDFKFITGVPCSFLKPFLSDITDKKDIEHIFATNEGEAVAIATGYYLATGNIPLVYMQNSGLGNAINALTSLCAQLVYSIPLVIFLTWRGKPGVKDEPQHALMGQIMIELLETLRIPYEFASDKPYEMKMKLSALKDEAMSHKHPTVMIFSSSLFNDISKKTEKNILFPMSREDVLEAILKLTQNNPIVSTTGKTSRELFELREKHNMSHKYDFLAVGSMGHTASIGLGIALNTAKDVFIIDGDGSILMKMGILATIGHYKPRNLIHIIVDNESYESTGAQPSVSNRISWKPILEGSGYKSILLVMKKEELECLDFSVLKKPCAVVIKVHPGSRKDLGRPTATPIENKKQFMKYLKEKK
ncbi:phosphonopyruvate decarboxylase [Candidatus Roizmanbacteria bacterium RIFCSPLOWO2_01_FULL_38_12]|uniref:Phosphonopyruvate decarboxylase n=1 Tax=Candidatus Roizmanbacteria bacterium RIFCSPLOWO2_01_FULL_38_12 TaxID=1802061 RepID=A0A1F7IST1_9BACT|nr:MAG: phosphonopyruvate decarboxylase [Candidatus Roizmanbacteria bacterium RIFCSPHIGHO2_01_FULL_38_15]OGK35803.1 MAG: phosphonopyruvate decarboxylase [Candidatus Roizmanbacteria bacterium RIFCSPHIGHO2_12_FULL_38_13]OGK46376.1 MAG: phosphonopyruvate decarboxylase [Candidatus Roizmanbacteria bacterium RIFCSPLOWO2_01_FULL_38_12]